MTRDQFAELVGITPQFLAEVEGGKKGISADTLYSICKSTNASADYILMGRLDTGKTTAPIAKLLEKIPAAYSEVVLDILTSVSHAIEISKLEEE